MESDGMNTAGFGPGDHELWEQIEGAGELSETIMRFVGNYSIHNDMVTREIIHAIAELERRLPPPFDE